MRISRSANGVRAKTYVGPSGVLLAFDYGEDLRHDLLGFAVERSVDGGPRRPLEGSLGWEGEAVPPGTRFPSTERPLQKFRWSDYAVEGGRTHQYRVRPVLGTADSFTVGSGPTVTVTIPKSTPGRPGITFNRAAAASQAFVTKFPTIAQDIDAARAAGAPFDLPPRARAWLSRGVLENIVGFIRRATGPTWELDIAIYEYEHRDIVDAVKAAHARGATVRVVFHAKAGDAQTVENEEHLKGLPAAAKRGRRPAHIFHHKFMVLRKRKAGAMAPVAVLCGSTNFTENGVHRQANVVHILDDTTIAGRYADLFDLLFAGADPAATRAWIGDNNPVTLDQPIATNFNPRRGGTDLDVIAARIAAARHDVLFCTAFNLDQRVLAALLGAPDDPVLRLGIQNKKSSITGTHRDRTAQFAAAAFLSKGIEGFLKESMAKQRGSILIHTKLVVVDFTSDAPFVLSGSHNLSPTAAKGSDENLLAINGDLDVADAYGIELLRFYDHYRFRWAMKQGFAAPALTRTPKWADRYYRPGSLNARDRLRFAGGGS